MLDHICMFALFCIIIPASISDMKHRSVSTYLIYAGYVISALVLVFYGFTSYTAAHIMSGVVGAALGLALILLGRHVTLLGSGDGHIIVISSVIIPWWNGTPVAMFGVLAGCILALLACLAVNVSYNIRDMAHGIPTPFSIDLFITHRKRYGEKFAVNSSKSSFHADIRVDSGTIKSHGVDLFEPETSHGQRVYSAIPMIPYIGAGICAVLFYVLVF